MFLLKVCCRYDVEGCNSAGRRNISNLRELTKTQKELVFAALRRIRLEISDEEEYGR